MTLMIAWLAVDSRGPSSAYIASDSRISWGESHCFNYAKKVFAFNGYPDILGYCGDVLFPTIVLSQIAEMVDCGLVFQDDFSCEQKSEAIMERLRIALNKYPISISGMCGNTLKIIHVSRDTSGKQFYCNLIEWDGLRRWSNTLIALPQKSDLLCCIGSGSTEYEENYRRYQCGLNTSTSRNVFQCFCDTLSNIRSNSCGGSPQLVGLYRKPALNAIKFGIIRDRRRYLFGAEVENLTNYNSILWRNDLFELCDGYTMARRENAMPQPNILAKHSL